MDGNDCLLLTLATYLLPKARHNEKPPPGMIRKWRFFLIFLVGATGFEPATSATPLQRATKLRHAPVPTGLSVTVPVKRCVYYLAVR